MDTLLYLNVFIYWEGGGGEQRKKEGKERRREGRKGGEFNVIYNNIH